MSKKRGLGKGLGALIEDRVDNSGAGAPLEVPVSAVIANPLQPRSTIKDKELKALADSISDKGVLEPLMVMRLSPDQYQLIAGERRLRASRLAGLETVPVILREATRAEQLELALIENLHREDLNPVEEAESYRRLSDEFERTQEEIARLSGRDRSTVANLLRLLSLPEPVKDDVRQGRLSAGHARALLALSTPQQILSAREQVLTRGLSVRETEALVKKANQPPRPVRPPQDQAYFEALSDSMTRNLGAKVRVLHRGKRGRIEISYSSNQELERLMRLLGVGPI
jgi:ParB family chromosome partitioning protein